MLTWRRRLARSGDEGFTLIEMVIAIAILGVVMAAVSAAMLASLRSNAETDDRLTESRDVQFASSWFGDDVQSANRVAEGGAPNCGTDLTSLVRFANTDILTPPLAPPTGSVDAIRVSYVLRPSADGSTLELHRLACPVGTGGPMTDDTIARTLSLTASQEVDCDTDPCSSSSTKVTLTLREKSGLEYQLHGTRRSS